MVEIQGLSRVLLLAKKAFSGGSVGSVGPEGVTRVYLDMYSSPCWPARGAEIVKRAYRNIRLIRAPYKNISLSNG